MGVTLKTLRRIEEKLREYHPRHGDDWLTAYGMRQLLKEEGWGTHPANIREAMEYLAERDLVERDTKDDCNFDNIGEHPIYRIIEED